MVVCVAVAHQAAHAQTPAPAPAPALAPAPTPAPAPADQQAPDQISGADEWDNAPKADQASGIEKGVDRGAGWLWIPRVIFFVPRWAFFLAMQPLRLGAYLYERYQLTDRFQAMFFNDTGTIGMFPVALFETGFGLNFGLRFVHKDLFGRSEGLRLRASYGGRFRQIYTAKLTSGNRLGERVSLEVDGAYEIRPKDLFYGIGNGDAVDAGTITMPIDPLSDDTAVLTRFRQRVTSLVLTADLALGGPLRARLSGHLMYRSFGNAEDSADPNATDVFRQDSMVGFEEGLSNLYSELELRYDSRRRTSQYLTRALPATGWLMSGYVGHTTGFDADPSDYVRVGLDLQRFINLYMGSRVLLLRFQVENLLGELKEIPFVDLPLLGGGNILRGHPFDRFRDRSRAVGTAEYRWDLGNRLAAFLFVDTGGVFRKLRDVDVDRLRVGYGGGLQSYTGSSFMARLHFASSIDGGFFFNLSFNPVTDPQQRAGRY
jgi:hypothetical protein